MRGDGMLKLRRERFLSGKRYGKDGFQIGINYGERVSCEMGRILPEKKFKILIISY